MTEIHLKTSTNKIGKNENKETNLYKALTDFCPLGCYQPIKNINLYAKFSQKSLILSKKVPRNLPKKKLIISKHHFAKF